MRIQFLDDFTRVLGEVKCGFDSDVHNVKGHILRGLEIMHLKINADLKIMIYEADEISRKGRTIANIIVLAYISHLDTKRREKEQGAKRGGARRGGGDMIVPA